MSKYQRGYLPKIEFHNTKLQEAIAKEDLGLIQKSLDSIQYFVGREQERVNNVK